MEINDKQGESVSTESGSITLQIRTARVQKHITVDSGVSIKDLRAKTAELFEIGDPSLTVLIFGGKILKDNEDIKAHDIKDGQTIHLVIRNKPSGDNSSATNNPLSTNQHQQQQQSTIATNASNNASDTIPNNNQPTTNPSFGNLSEVQQRLQQMLISNPETMQNMISPMLQQMTTNPEMFRSLFGSMQRMQSLMERNPEVNHLLSNPDVLRESLEMVRNPAALQEVMRNYDRALNNMESMPGGYNVLRRMYTEFQEPLLSAFQEQFNGNQFDSQANSESNNNPEPNAGETEQQRTENRDPLPNPWASPAQTNRPQFPSGAAAGLGGGNSNLADDRSNAASAANILGPAANMFQNPEFMSLLTNPEAIQSVEQIQQGFERLQRIAPSLFSRLDLPQLPRLGAMGGLNSGSAPSDTNQQSNAADPMAQMMRLLQGQTRGSDPTSRPATAGAAANPFNPSADGQQSAEATRMLMQLLGGGAQGSGAANGGSDASGNATGIDPTAALAAAAAGQRPEEQYSQQLQQLSEMGFPNRESNLRALIETFGDINAAIARLLPQ